MALPRLAPVVSLTLLGLLVSQARCTFPEREFDDAKYNQANAGGAAGQGGPGGAAGAGQGGSGGETSGAGQGGEGVGGESGAGGVGNTGGVGVGGAGVGGAGAAGSAAGMGGAGAGAGGAGMGGAGSGQGGAGQAGAGQAGSGGACVDEGKKLACGKGECAREVPACLGGVSQQCVPGKPSLEACGDGLDNNCNDKNDEYCAGGCTHDVCQSAGKLKNDCSPCVGAICETAQFSKCCGASWDPDCIAAVAVVCEVALCKFNCVHGVCEAGAPLAKNCDKPSAVGVSCVSKICEDTPSCCSATWDQTCIDKVNTICNLGCSL